MYSRISKHFIVILLLCLINAISFGNSINGIGGIAIGGKSMLDKALYNIGFTVGANFINDITDFIGIDTSLKLTLFNNGNNGDKMISSGIAQNQVDDGGGVYIYSLETSLNLEQNIFGLTPHIGAGIGGYIMATKSGFQTKGAIAPGFGVNANAGLSYNFGILNIYTDVDYKYIFYVGRNAAIQEYGVNAIDLVAFMCGIGIAF